VVDPDLEVCGLERLRVCASSIMPRLVSSNTKAADLVGGIAQRDVVRHKELQAAT
jgi:choline dehydrogenase-like flavoprotein